MLPIFPKQVHPIKCPTKNLTYWANKHPCGYCRVNSSSVPAPLFEPTANSDYLRSSLCTLDKSGRDKGQTCHWLNTAVKSGYRAIYFSYYLTNISICNMRVQFNQLHKANKRLQYLSFSTRWLFSTKNVPWIHWHFPPCYSSWLIISLYRFVCPGLVFLMTVLSKFTSLKL